MEIGSKIVLDGTEYSTLKKGEVLTVTHDYGYGNLRAVREDGGYDWFISTGTYTSLEERTNKMIIETGKYYKASDGSKVGPMTGYNFKWVEGCSSGGDPGWSNGGTPLDNTALHLIAEWTDEETGTLEELGVKEGDVVELTEGIFEGEKYYIGFDGRINSITREGDYYGYVIDDIRTPLTWKLISRANTAPKLWRDMTPEEKGALLLAAHGGEVIENSRDGFKTVYTERPFWSSDYAYRIKPKLITTQGTVSIKNEYGVVTHTSPIDITDGVPDTTTIKLEDV